MDQLEFDQRRSTETLATVLRQLLTAWMTLSESTRQQVEARRQQLRRELPTTPPIQRIGRILALLRELEVMPELQSLIGATLQAGKGPSYRMLVQLSDDQVRELLNVLATPAPEAANKTVADDRLPFQLRFDVAQPVSENAPLPVMVNLTPDTRPADQRFDSIWVPFADLRQPVALEVKLIAPHFQEATGDWTRTIQVYAVGPSLPAVFLVEGALPPGEQSFWVQFAQVTGSGLRKIEISHPVQVRVIPPPDPSRGPTRGVPSEEKTDFYTDVRFPGQVQPRKVYPLIVRLTLEQVSESLAKGLLSVTFGDANKAELLEVVVTAPGFTERTTSPRLAFCLFSRADSQPAIFLLEPGPATGQENIALDFYHKGRLLLHTSFATEITEQLAGTPAAIRLPNDGPPMEPPPLNPPPPPDLTLRITYDDQRRRLHFQLHSENPDVGYRDQDVGEVQLKIDPYQVLEQTWLQLSTLAGTTAVLADKDAQLEELEVLGQNLFQSLLPPAMQQKEYWAIKKLRDEGKIRSLLILSDEPWIPWEMMKPFFQDRQTNQIYEDGFLAEVFPIARWLTARGVAPATQVLSARLVAPSSNLAASEVERQFFNSLADRRIDVGKTLATRDEVFDAFKNAKIKLFHVAAHGNFNHDDPNNSQLELEAGNYLRPEDLAPVRTSALRRERPLVFLNACHGGQVGFALTGLGGWAQRMVADINVSAFIGALWEIDDQLAAEFAVSFYQQLMEGKRLAEAFRAARLHIRDLAPGNSTWLAYVLYADPNATVSWGS